MKILYICLGNPFTEEMLYIENYLIKGNYEDGMDIEVIASTLKFSSNKIKEVNESKTFYFDKIPVIRIKHDHIINKFISNIIRKNNRLFEIIINFKPDVIFYNCIQIYNIKDLKKIKQSLPNVKIYGDVTTTKYNSGKNLLSYYILHKIIYKSWIKKAERYFDKIFYPVLESKEFLKSVYKINDKLLEFFPLACEVIDEFKKKEYRRNFESRYNLNQNVTIFSHSGKMDKLKLTIEILEKFIKTRNENFRLFIAGEFTDDIKDRALKTINSDNRIKYIGFLDNEDLIELLCSTDLYLQPGSPSHTAQTAMGCLTPVVLKNIKTYEPFFNENGYMINNVNQLDWIFNQININPHCLKEMSSRSKLIAENMLNYRKLSRRLWKGNYE